MSKLSNFLHINFECMYNSNIPIKKSQRADEIVFKLYLI